MAERRERLRRAEQRGAPRLAAPRQSTPVRRVAVFDDTSPAVRREHREELLLATRAPYGDVDTDRDIETIDGIGPWEHHVRRLIAGGWPDGIAESSDHA